MQYDYQTTEEFLREFNKLSKKGKNVLKRKIKLTSKNPGRNKKLKGIKDYFRIRFKDNNKELRAIYCIESDTILFTSILERKHNYKDFTDRN